MRCLTVRRLVTMLLCLTMIFLLTACTILALLAVTATLSAILARLEALDSDFSDQLVVILVQLKPLLNHLSEHLTLVIVQIRQDAQVCRNLPNQLIGILHRLNLNLTVFVHPNEVELLVTHHTATENSVTAVLESDISAAVLLNRAVDASLLLLKSLLCAHSRLLTLRIAVSVTILAALSIVSR